MERSDKRTASSIWNLITNCHSNKILIKDIIAGVNITNPMKVAQSFQSEFQERYKPCVADCSEFLETLRASKEVFHQNVRWKFRYASIKKVIKKIDGLKKSTMSGPDQIQTGFLKAIKHQVAPILTQLINMTIFQQFYPASLVEGRRIVVYKEKIQIKRPPAHIVRWQP